MDAVRALPRYLIERYKGWRASTYDENRAWYTRLATEALFGAEPGELFMLRNVANLAPPYKPSHEHHGTSAAIEFAITGLGVTNLIVLGHAQCGGVKAFVEMSKKKSSCCTAHGSTSPLEHCIITMQKAATSTPSDKRRFINAPKQSARVTFWRVR